MFSWFKKTYWRVCYDDDAFSCYMEKNIALDYATIFPSKYIESQCGKKINTEELEL